MKISVITPTHDHRWLLPAYESLKAQTIHNWEWIVVPNNFERGANAVWTKDCLERIDDLCAKCDARVRIVDAPAYMRGRSVGAIKAFAFAQATGDVVLELDHDDLLAPMALDACSKAFEDSEVDFVYSDCADFSDPPGMPITYYLPERRAAWEADGWKFGVVEVPKSLVSETKNQVLPYPVCFPPSAASFALIMHAPNHFRAWRRSFYERIGGHDGSLEVCDDHELMIRTYLLGNRLVKIPEVLYFYRVNGHNTWAQNVDKIRAKTEELRAKHLQALVAKECERRGLPCYDLGGAFDSPGKPWVPVDREIGAHRLGDNVGISRFVNGGEQLITDLNDRWPFPDSSVGAFRAVDLLEHLPNKLHTMSEIYRCLAPGGWLLSSTPHALGEGAHQDPTHVSYWVENSFRYYTEARLAKYIHNANERFMAVRLFKTDGPIPYVVADLVSLKDDDGTLPGRRGI